MSADISKYLDLITSEHRDKPKFIAMLSYVLQAIADTSETIQSIPALFDLDVAVGDQLDKTGEWIGVGRTVELPITTYFSFDIPGSGWDEADWWEVGDPVNETVTLTDAQYRTLLKARALNNQWDGSIEKAYEIWSVFFEGTGLQIFIVDHGDLTMSLGFVALTSLPDDVTIRLFQSGYLDIRPATISIRDYFIPASTGKMFALGIENDYFGGLGVGSFPQIIPGGV